MLELQVARQELSKEGMIPNFCLQVEGVATGHVYEELTVNQFWEVRSDGFCVPQLHQTLSGNWNCYGWMVVF